MLHSPCISLILPLSVKGIICFLGCYYQYEQLGNQYEAVAHGIHARSAKNWGGMVQKAAIEFDH